MGKKEEEIYCDVDQVLDGSRSRLGIQERADHLRNLSVTLRGRGRVTAPTPSSRCSALSSSVVDRRRSGLFPDRGGGGASTVHQSRHTRTARARRRVQEMAVIVPSVASASFGGDGYGMQDVASPRETALRRQLVSLVVTEPWPPHQDTQVLGICFFLHISTRVVNLESFRGLSLLPSRLLFHLSGQDTRLVPAFRERLNTFHRS